MTDPQAQSFLAIPTSGKGPGVLVLHAWWGLNDFFRDLCNRLAQAGFVALAPDMFSGEVVRTVEEANQHLSQFNEVEEVPPIVLKAVAELGSNPAVTGDKLAVVGFSMGAYWALWLAGQHPEWVRSVTIFYGTNGGDGDFQESKAAFLGHFAEKDEFEPQSSVDNLEETLRSAGRPVTFYRYPGTGHWFFEEDVPQAYNPAAAGLAWERTLAFLKQP